MFKKSIPKDKIFYSDVIMYSTCLDHHNDDIIVRNSQGAFITDLESVCLIKLGAYYTNLSSINSYRELKRIMTDPRYNDSCYKSQAIKTADLMLLLDSMSKDSCAFYVLQDKLRPFTDSIADGYGIDTTKKDTVPFKILKAINQREYREHDGMNEFTKKRIYSIQNN